MTASALSATIRVTVAGPAGRVDLAVPSWMDVAAVAAGYAEALAVSAPELVAASGAPLPASVSLDEAGLRHGDVVVATSADHVPGDETAGVEAAQVARRLLPPRARVLALTAAVSSAVVAAGLLATRTDAGAWRPVGVAVLLLAALVALTPPVLGGARDWWVAAVAPAYAAAAGFLLGYDPAPGGLLLAVCAGSCAAAVLAAASRATLDGDDELATVWLVVAAALAVLSGMTLLAGAPSSALCAVLFAVAVVAARLLPFTVVDVPDQALLDLDRLAVTAWSAREQPRGSRRRRSMVRPDGVAAVVRRGQRLVAAGSVAVALTVVVTGPLLVLGSGPDLEGWGATGMVVAGAAALALVARSFRAAVPRFALRASAGLVLAAAGLDLALTVLPPGGPWPAGGWVVAVVTAGLAAVVTLTAVALGRGWRSVWWARAADVTEALAVVLVLPGLVLASGMFALIRGFTS